MNQPRQQHQLIERAELVCMALLQADIDVALAFLQLAQTELQSGATAHARELVEKAILAHKDVMKGLEQLPAGFERERCVLEQGGRKLVQAIVAAEREFHIL